VGRVESEIFPVHTMKVYGGGGGIALFILNLGTRPAEKEINEICVAQEKNKKMFKILSLGTRRTHLVLSCMYQMTY